MEGTPKSPWWFGLPLALGWAVMGAFAPSVLPQWTQEPFFLLALASVVWGIAGSVWHYRNSWGRRMSTTIGLIVAGILIIVLGGILVVMGVRQLRTALSPPSSGTTTPAEDSRIVVECDRVIPEQIIGGRYNLLNLSPVEHGNAVSQHGASGGRFNAGDLRVTHVCRLTNFAPATLINVHVPLRVGFAIVETTHSPDGSVVTTAGAPSLVKDGEIFVRRLDNGPSASFEIFIQNGSAQLANLEFEKLGEGQRVDRSSPEKIAISTTMGAPIGSYPPASNTVGASATVPEGGTGQIEAARSETPHSKRELDQRTLIARPQSKPSGRDTDAATDLAAFIDEGRDIQARFMASDDAARVKAEQEAWAQKVEKYLGAHVGHAQAVQFSITDANPWDGQPSGRSEAGGYQWAKIVARNKLLAQYLREAQDQK